MAEYIERDKALEDFDKWIDETGAIPKGTSYYYECRACIEDVPSADVVEVVRCKDCEHWGGVIYGFVCRKFSGIETKICMHADDFCSYGERRSENES
jgi:hypothetical protein